MGCPASHPPRLTVILKISVAIGFSLMPLKALRFSICVTIAMVVSSTLDHRIAKRRYFLCVPFGT